ncbi:hypothetical protein ABIC80_001327 [Kosakonia sp. 1610]
MINIDIFKVLFEIINILDRILPLSYPYAVVSLSP